MSASAAKTAGLASFHPEPIMPRSAVSGAHAILLVISVGPVFAVALAYFINTL